MVRRFAGAATLVLVLIGLAWADFPADLYTSVDKGTCVSLDSECGCSTGECICDAGVCKYDAAKIENLADREEQVEDALAGASCSAVQMSCVIEPEDMDTAAELRGLMASSSEYTGTGPVCFADTPNLVTPKLLAYSAPANLPTAGTEGRIATVENASGDCTIGSGSDRCLCYDNGTSWDTLACGPTETFTLKEDSIEIEDPLDQTDVIMGQADPDGPSRTLIRTWARYTGTCATPPQFAFETTASTPAAIDLTGGGNLSPVTGSTAATATTFSTSDSDRIIAAGHAYAVSIINTPVCNAGAKVAVWVVRS